MKKRIPIGLKSYEKLKNESYYVVDKTLMIKDFLDRGNEVTLITRPRRFGKTINMSMMTEFFDITKDSKKLFEDTFIMKTDYASELNQYPTIFISFADAKGDVTNMIRQIKVQLQNEYDRFKDVFINLTEFEENDYHKIKADLMDNDNGKLNSAVNALSFLMKILQNYYGKKVMVFIDEYDTPFIEAHVGGFYDDIRNDLASMLHTSLKTSTSLQYAMLTGIQRVAKENIFSDLNNLVVCTVKDYEYSQHFGFTEEETKEMLEYYGLELNDEVKLMYNGYQFGDCAIYNPWSVLNYASRKVLSPYWVNTSGNKMIRKAMEGRNPSFDRNYEELIQKGTLETLIHMETSFFELNTNENLWGLLVNAGYLTITQTISIMEGIYTVKIPNKEVQQEFKNLTAYYLDVADSDLTLLFSALKRNKKDDFIEKYQKILLSLPSYHDLKDENSYHVLFLGMCAWLSSEYEIISNREEGKGRCDIILKAKEKNRISYVFEFKYIKSNNEVSKEQLSEIAKQAVDQIKDKEYGAGLSDKVIYVGLAHHNKEAFVEWWEN